MGCALNKPNGHSDNSPQVFRVFNVDDRGHERNPGKIEINEQDLILFQRGKEAIHWPLRSLRRYGFDAELFSFESGRRCPTGPGIYAFKCRRAEALFNLLQEFIVRAGQEENRQSNPPTVDGSRPNSLVEIQNQGPSTPSPRHEYMNGDIRNHEYVNTAIPSHSPVQYNRVVDSGAIALTVHRDSHSAHACRKSSEHVIQYAELDLPKTGEEGGGEEGASGPLPNGQCSSGGAVGGAMVVVGAEDEDDVDEEPSQAMYINVPAMEIKRPCRGPPLTRLSSLQQRHAAPPLDEPPNYANLGLLASGAPRVGATKLKEPSIAPKVQYIQLDLKNSRENVAGAGSGGGGMGSSGHTPNSPISLHSTPDSPSRKTDSYAMIDFDRTQALHARNAVSEDEGSRKTRHNSNIEELNWVITGLVPYNDYMIRSTV